jgi:hypothetical protein
MSNENGTKPLRNVFSGGKSNDDSPICHLCGEAITKRMPGSDDSQTREHVPPKQFYPKPMRAGLNLWTDIPAHKKCNNAYQEDEDYFYHTLYPLVQNANKELGDMMLTGIRRRAAQPQTRARIRELLETSSNTSPGGVLLPPGMVRLSGDKYRLQRVAIKIAQGVFLHRYRRFMPKENCKDIRLFKSPEDVPEWYSLSWQFSEAHAVTEKVFSYRAARLDNYHVLTLLFWEAFAFCLTFEDPQSQDQPISDEAKPGGVDGECGRA